MARTKLTLDLKIRVLRSYDSGSSIEKTAKKFNLLTRTVRIILNSRDKLTTLGISEGRLNRITGGTTSKPSKKFKLFGEKRRKRH